MHYQRGLGTMDGFLGCTANELENTVVPHSVTCTCRIESEMHDDPGLKRKLKEAKDKTKKSMHEFMKKQADDRDRGRMKDIDDKGPGWHHEVTVQSEPSSRLGIKRRTEEEAGITDMKELERWRSVKSVL